MKQVNQIHSIAIIGNGLMGQGMAWHGTGIFSLRENSYINWPKS
ncbi:MAG: hypothetical protein ACI810_001615 [Gammaproteobacteria bacterium]|jgi:hypothetical protein